MDIELLAKQNEERMDGARYRFLCQHPHWGFIEELCREFAADDLESFKAGLDAAIAKRWTQDEFSRLVGEALKPAGTK